ncbi:hypothetical protein OPIT5_15010 [Opitutaceae bacterium TAV5]|nr:hypothetical protein OPIT5_15010 [Opitutaceae bacterium TAV5]
MVLAALCLGLSGLTARTTTGNLLQNPAFADGDGDGFPDGWTPYPPGDGDTRIIAPATGGGIVFKDNDKNSGLGIEQWVPVQEGLRYTASADISGTGVTLNIFFVAKKLVRAGDLNKVKLSSKSARTAAGARTEVVAVAPAGATWAKIWFYCPKAGIADAVIRDAALTSATLSPSEVAAAAPAPAAAPAVSAPSGPVPQGNLLKNPVFADADGDGTPDGWNPYPPGNGDTLVLAPAPGGGLVFKDNDKNNGLGIEQWVPVQEGLNYTASAEVAGNGGVSLVLIFAPSIPNRPGDLKKIQLADKSARAAAGQPSTVPAIAPAGAKWVKVWLYSPKVGVTDVVIKQASLVASVPSVAAVNAATAAAAVAARPLPPGLASVIDFETGDLSQAHMGKAEGGDVTVITAAEGPVREGKYSARIAIKADKHRAEVPGYRSGAYGVARYGWSIYIPKEFDAQTFFSIITQWHSWGTGRESPKDGGPPTCMNISKGKLHLKLLAQGDDGWTSKATYLDICAVDEMRGRWNDFVMEVNWQGPGKGGWLKLYKDGKLAIDYKGTTWYDDKDKGPYFKFGTYKGGGKWRGTEEGAILYVDAARMALGEQSTCKMVDPAAYAPRPVRE